MIPIIIIIILCLNYSKIHNSSGEGNLVIPDDYNDDVYLDKSQTRRVKKSILYM
jgi:hypothetical protein